MQEERDARLNLFDKLEGAAQLLCCALDARELGRARRDESCMASASAWSLEPEGRSGGGEALRSSGRCSRAASITFWDIERVIEASPWVIDAVAGKGGGRALGADIAVLGSQELAGAFSDGPGARLAEEHVVDNRDEEAVGVGRDEAPERAGTPSARRQPTAVRVDSSSTCHSKPEGPSPHVGEQSSMCTGGGLRRRGAHRRECPAATCRQEGGRAACRASMRWAHRP